jgi:tetratricopeptide (TPR) repeat protein
VEVIGLAWLRMKNLPEDYPPSRREVVWLAGSAYAWMSAQKPDRSQEYLDKLAAYYNQEPRVHFLRGSVFEAENRDADARNEYREELKISPDYTAVLVRLALLDLRLNELNEARDAVRHAIALEPGNAQSHFALGRVLLADKKWAESAAEFEKTRQIEPKVAEVHFYLAKAYRQLGRETDASREDAAYNDLKNKHDSQASKTDAKHATVDGRAK